MDHKLYQALGDLKRGVQRRAHNRRKRDEGIVVKPRPQPTVRVVTADETFHRDESQIAAYREKAKSQFPDN